MFIIHTRPPLSGPMCEQNSPLFNSPSLHLCLPVACSLVIGSIYFRFLSGSRCPDIGPLIQSDMQRKLLESIQVFITLRLLHTLGIKPADVYFLTWCNEKRSVMYWSFCTLKTNLLPSVRMYQCSCAGQPHFLKRIPKTSASPRNRLLLRCSDLICVYGTFSPVMLQS